MLETMADLVGTAIKAEPAIETQIGPYIFVLMPFDNEFDDVYDLGIKTVAKDLKCRCERVDDIEFNDQILAKIYECIQRADIIIADMTGKNPNVFYEVGYAHALGKEVILVTKKADDIPFDLKGHNHIIYEGRIKNLKEMLIKRLKSYSQRVEHKNV